MKYKLIYIFFISFLLLTANVYAQCTWSFCNQVTTNDLYKIKFLNNNYGYAVGNNGTIINTQNGGTNWTSLTSGTKELLLDISIINETTAFVVGTNNFLAKTSDGGLNWVRIQLDTYLYHLYSIKFFNDSTGIIIGRYTSYQGPYQFNFTRVYKTYNSGNNWSIVDVVNDKYNGDFFFNENTGYIGFGRETQSQRLLKTTDGGQTIVLLNVPTEYTYRIIYFINELTGFAGSSHIFKTTDGGMNWIETNLTSNSDNLPNSIYFTNSMTGFAVGNSGNIRYTTDGGINWGRNITDPNFQNYQTIQFLSVTFTNNNIGFISGRAGYVLKSTNGGNVFVPPLFTNVPVDFILYQNYPNPFNPSTIIKYNIAKNSFVTIKVFDLLGREMTTLINEFKTTGNYQVEFNTKDKLIASGIYYYRMELKDQNFVNLKKMIVLK